MFLEMTDDDVTAPSSEWHLATLFSVNTHTWSWCFKYIETERETGRNTGSMNCFDAWGYVRRYLSIKEVKGN